MEFKINSRARHKNNYADCGVVKSIHGKYFKFDNGTPYKLISDYEPYETLNEKADREFFEANIKRQQEEAVKQKLETERYLKIREKMTQVISREDIEFFERYLSAASTPRA